MEVTINNVKNTWLKVGVMLIVSRMIERKSLNEQAWMKSSLLTLLGFAAYHIFTSKFIDVGLIDTARFRPLLDDWLTIGTMLIVSRLLSGEPLDSAWINSSLYTLVGFSAYDVITYKFVDTTGLSPKIKALVDDWVKMGTMMVVSRLLENKSFDETWTKSSLAVLAGFSAYDLLFL